MDVTKPCEFIGFGASRVDSTPGSHAYPGPGCVQYTTPGYTCDPGYARVPAYPGTGVPVPY